MTSITDTAPLFRDLIEIPERIHSGDFVLKLSEGLAHSRETVRDYVVTPQLSACFDDALSFIESAVTGATSKAAYLHGSFGAGKSHFMAVLNLLLAGDRHARGIPELSHLVVKHDGWSSGRRFLMVPYHMIGERDLESAILGQYARHVAKLHPDAPLPGFYLSESLFQDAQALRRKIGDAQFFAGLNHGKESAASDGWGALDSGLWDASGVASAMREPAAGHERQRLMGDLIRVWFPSYGRVADSAQAYLPLDEGLSVLGAHAQSLGYDAVVLFLDELILWLATHAANVDFVTREGSKLSKLVEFSHARPVPLISFIARQRDLRDLVGQNLAGSVQLQFADTLRHWEARFHKITLEDRNLPVIVRKRILRPKSESARQVLDDAFKQTMKMRRTDLDVLLGTTGEEAIFRDVYPFSPALVQALIAVSSALQRERTALRLMLQLLVDRRDELAVGQLIPVGDLYDVIAGGDDAFSEAMRVFFLGAKKLYDTKLLPMIERQNDVTWEAMRQGRAPADKAAHLRNDARLIKTLLLAALVPEVEALKALRPKRLAALNHGNVRSPLPGQEGSIVLSKLRAWASEVGEIKISEESGHDPVVSLQITGVDTDPILAGVETEDNNGNRRRLIRKTLFDMLGIEDDDKLFQEYTFVWRGTRRSVNIVYENVREMSADRLRSQPGAWTVVFDYPFDDDANKGSSDDRARLSDFRETEGQTDTLVWLPAFLSTRALRDLGTLVKLEYLLAGDRFAEHARHLSAVDRDQAKVVLGNQRVQLRQRLRACLEVAYGLSNTPHDAVESSLPATEHLYSLDGFKPSLPVGADLKSAFNVLLDELFRYLHPGHPQFDVEVKRATLASKIWPEIRKALAEPGGRLFIGDKTLRETIRAVTNPLKLADMGETHLVIEHESWKMDFNKQHARQGGPMTVRMLRDWMEKPVSRGLGKEVQNLVILTYAEQTSRLFMNGSMIVEPTLDRIDDDLELREQALPSEEEWHDAATRAKALLAVIPLEVRNVGNVAKLSNEVIAAAKKHFDAVKRMSVVLENRLRDCGVDPDGADRMITARSARLLLAALIEASPDRIVSVLAGAELRTSAMAVAKAIAAAERIEKAFGEYSWTVFDRIGQLADQRREAGQVVLRDLVECLSADEHVVALRPALEEQFNKALDLLTETPVPVPIEPAAPVVPAPVAPSGPSIAPVAPAPSEPTELVVEAAQRQGLAPAEARDLLARLEQQLRAHPEWRLDLSWRIVRRGERT